MSRRRIPTQDDIRAAGRCGHGYRPSDGDHCGEESRPGAVFGYCAEHDDEFAAMTARINGQEES